MPEKIDCKYSIQEKVTVGVGKTYGGTGCYEFKAIGCLDNGEKVWFSTCVIRNTSAHHAPVCLKGKRVYNLPWHWRFY